MLTLEKLAELLENNRDAARSRVKEFSIGGRRFEPNSRPAIMGVINLSPDSWYRESVCLTSESAVRRGRVLLAQGAEIVDVGAESTLAHAAREGAASQNSKSKVGSRSWMRLPSPMRKIMEAVAREAGHRAESDDLKCAVADG